MKERPDKDDAKRDTRKCPIHNDIYLDIDVQSVKRLQGRGHCPRCDLFWSLDQPKPPDPKTDEERKFLEDYLKRVG